MSGVDSLAFRGGGYGKHLGCPQHLAEALVLAEIESAVAAVIEVGKHDRAAVGEAEFVADKGRDAAFVGDALVIKKIGGIKGGVAGKFKETAMDLVSAGLGDHVGETGRAVSDLRRYHSRTRLHFLDGVHVEVGEGGASDFRIGGVESIQGEYGGGAALAIDGKLLGEVGGAVGVGHGACGEQEQLAEVARIQRQAGNLSAGKALTATGLGRGFFAGG